MDGIEGWGGKKNFPMSGALVISKYDGWGVFFERERDGWIPGWVSYLDIRAERGKASPFSKKKTKSLSLPKEGLRDQRHE